MAHASGADARRSGVHRDTDADPAPADPSDPTALEALRPLASTEVAVTASLSHRELFTTRGLLTILRHRPPIGARSHRSAIVACGGAMGGLLGPGQGLYQRLGERWVAHGVEFVRVGYREPNNLDLCAHDLACGVELARDAGAQRVVVMGHSFGGAVAVRTAVIMPVSVAGVGAGAMPPSPNGSTTGCRTCSVSPETASPARSRGPHGRRLPRPSM